MNLSPRKRKPRQPRRRRGQRRGKRLRIGLFGGTFDPIHNGHLAVARAARRAFHLDAIYFIPCGRPPHKDRPGLSPYLHRFTMVALACADEPRFLPSLLEAGRDLGGRERHYSIETVRRLRQQWGKKAQLYFLLGADAFLTLPRWKHFAELIRLCDFIAAARPGVDWRRARRAVPRSATVHFLPRVRADVSATEIRRCARLGRSLRDQVPRVVREYIEKMRLYQSSR